MPPFLFVRKLTFSPKKKKKHDRKTANHYSTSSNKRQPVIMVLDRAGRNRERPLYAFSQKKITLPDLFRWRKNTSARKKCIQTHLWFPHNTRYEVSIKKREKRDTYCFLCRIWQPLSLIERPLNPTRIDFTKKDKKRVFSISTWKINWKIIRERIVSGCVRARLNFDTHEFSRIFGRGSFFLKKCPSARSILVTADWAPPFHYFLFATKFTSNQASSSEFRIKGGVGDLQMDCTVVS